MRLVNLLKNAQGVPEQGREVTIRLRHRGPAGVPTATDVPAVMLPLSEVEVATAERLARETVEGESPPLPAGSEAVVRTLQACLRDPADLSKRLIEDERDLQALRDGLVGPQYQRLIDEYLALMATEYPEVVSEAAEKDMEAQARDFSPSDQPARG